MNAKVDWEGAPPDPQDKRDGGTRGWRALGKDGRLVAIVGVGAIALIAAAVLAGRGHADNDAAVPAVSPTTPAPSAPGVDTAGIAQGQATAAGRSCTRLVSGLPWGCPHTLDGAVEAGTQVAAHQFDMQRMSSTDRAAWQTTVLGQPLASAQDEARAYREAHALDESGQQTLTGERFTSACHPELGAYRVKEATADAVTVDLWAPCIEGTTGPAVPELTVRWTIGQISLAWKGTDWQVSHIGAADVDTVPTPVDDRPVTTFADRAQILSGYGPGWQLYADASQNSPAEMGDDQ